MCASDGGYVIRDEISAPKHFRELELYLAGTNLERLLQKSGLGTIRATRNARVHLPSHHCATLGTLWLGYQFGARIRRARIPNDPLNFLEPDRCTCKEKF